MSDRLWTSDDPQPEDLDAALENTEGWVFERLPPNPDAKASFVIDVDAEDFDCLKRISDRRGETPHEVIAQLLRDAERSAA